MENLLHIYLGLESYPQLGGVGGVLGWVVWQIVLDGV
jgi:hypothetical protein